MSESLLYKFNYEFSNDNREALLNLWLIVILHKMFKQLLGHVGNVQYQPLLKFYEGFLRDY